MKYLLMELPSFTVGLILGIFGLDILSYSIIYFILFLVFLFILYQSLTYAYMLQVKDEFIQEEQAPNNISPIEEKEIKVEVEEKPALKIKEEPKFSNQEYKISKFRILKDLTLNGIMTNQTELHCKIILKEKKVEIVNLDNLKIDLFRFNSLVELRYIEIIA